MLSCAGRFAGLYFGHARAPTIDEALPALSVRRGPARKALEPARRTGPLEGTAPLQRARGRARGGDRGNALPASQGAGGCRSRRAPRHRRPAGPRGIPPHGKGPRAGPRDLRPRAVGREMDAVADRIFLETTRRYAPPRLAREDVAAALLLAQVEPGKPVADLGCGYGRHLEALVEQGHAHPIGIDRSALLLREAAVQVRTALLVRADL